MKKSMDRKRCFAIIVAFMASLILCGIAGEVNAALYVSQSTDPLGNSAARSTWLGWINTIPEYMIDFERYTAGTSVTTVNNDLTGLVIGPSTATVQSNASYFGGSNPVGSLALALTEGSGVRLTLNFSTFPVDYVAFQDIDQAGANGIVTFVGGGTTAFTLDTTNVGGNSAEFIGLWRNDMPGITKVEITEVSGSGGWGVDNIEYGQVPIPPTVWLLGAGLMGLVGLRRKFKK